MEFEKDFLKDGEIGLVDAGDLFSNATIGSTGNASEDGGQQNIDLGDIDDPNKDSDPEKNGDNQATEGKDTVGDSQGSSTGGDQNSTNDDANPSNGSENTIELDYKSVFEKLASRGSIKNVSDMVFDIDGQETPWSDMKIESEEEMLDMLQTLIENEKSTLLDGKEDVSALSNVSKQVIEIEKAGGDPVAFLRMYENVQKPLEGIDLDSKDGQLKTLRHFYNLKAATIGQEDADELYNNAARLDEDQLLQKAEKAKQQITKYYEDQTANYKKSLADQKAARIESEKKYKKSLKENINKTFTLNDTHSSKLIDFATKKVKVGETELTQAQKIFTDMYNNPETAPDLLYFLMDKEGFLKHKSSEVVRKNTSKIVKMIKNTPKDRQTAPINDIDGESKDVLDLGIDLSNL